MQTSKVGNQEVEESTINLLEKVKMPVSIGFVAYHLKITWQTARSLLLRMSLTEKINAIETSKGYMFALKAVSQN